MKKLFLLFAATLIAVSVMAEIYPTKFLGIPIDGTKAEMIKKIQDKGFTYNSEYDYLSGEFNGQDVHIYIVTNNNRVYRVMVAEQTLYSEGQIRIRYNNLRQQFIDNPKYLTYKMGQTFIPDDEDISYEMTVKNKLYEANFLQTTHELDTTIIAQDAMSVFQNIEDYLPTSVASEMKPEVLVDYCMIMALMKQYEKNMVWFRICEFKGKYYLTLYYDNLYNKANGEDL